MKSVTALFFISLCAAAGVADAAPYIVAAIAPDEYAAVLSTPDGRLQRFQRGERVASGDWRLVRVGAGTAVFERRLPGRNAPLAVAAKPGESIDFDALDARHARTPESGTVLHSRIGVVPAREPATP